MGRLSTLDEASVFDAVGTLIARSGSMTLQGVVQRTGVSIGSLYHRYGSREGLLALTWLDTVQSFQTRFLRELESGAKDAGERAAMATPRFCRDEPNRARILVCCRRQELLSSKTPDDLCAKIDAINVNASKAIKNFAKARGHSPQACFLGLVAFPLGAVRLFLPDHDVPKNIDAQVCTAYHSALACGG